MNRVFLEDLQVPLKAEGALWGFAALQRTEVDAAYSKALAFAVPYSRQLTPETYTEPLFEQEVADARKTVETLLEKLERVLQAHGIPYRIPPTGQRDEIQLEAEVSFKFAAVQAGLGWIGKNDTLVTETFGPRLRLSVILLETEVPCGCPVTKSKCPPGCTLCTGACPCGAVQGVLWEPKTTRRTLLDYHQCNCYRSSAIPKLGRKDACGKCMTVCPWGRKR